MTATAPSTIICVDDDKWMLTVLADQLSEWFGKDYEIEKALSGGEALELIDSCMEDNMELPLVISDYVMPGMKGDEFLEQVKNKTPMTRRIMLTGFAAIDGITNAINKAGIYRFMAKPWDNKDMLLTVLQALRSYESDKRTEKLAKSHAELYRRYEALSVDLQSNLDQVMAAFARAAEEKSGERPGHAARVADYCGRIAAQLKIPETETRILKMSAYLHDAGKLCLSSEELSAMSGNQRLTRKDLAQKQAQGAKQLLADMDPAVLPGIIYHLERIDGDGPFGIAAANIPLEARIIGLCNHLDVLCSVYADIAPAEVLSRLSHEKGKIFDGLLFDTLAKVL